MRGKAVRRRSDAALVDLVGVLATHLGQDVITGQFVAVLCSRIVDDVGDQLVLGSAVIRWPHGRQVRLWLIARGPFCFDCHPMPLGTG